MNASVSIDWRSMSPNDLIGRRFLASDGRGTNLDGPLRVIDQRSMSVTLGLKNQAGVMRVISVPVPRDRTRREYFGDDPEPEILTPWIGVNVLEERP